MALENLIKVGDYVINTAMITHVELKANSYKTGADGKHIYNDVRITLTSVKQDGGTFSDTLQFDGEQADALRWFFSSEVVDHLFDITDLYRKAITKDEADDNG
jgi:hypothetical protein